jgi:hypothetical protein
MQKILGGPSHVTIAVALQVHDGVVLASDSALTLTDTSAGAGPNYIQNVYNNSNKIFNLRKGLPLGAVTYGLGNIGNTSISTLAKSLRARFTGVDETFPSWKIDKENYTIEQVAIRAREFFLEEMAEHPPVPGFVFGFQVAGYSARAPLSEIWKFEHVNGVCDPPRCAAAQGETGFQAGGDPEVFSRLVLGHGMLLGDALVAGGVDRANIPAVVAALQAHMHVPLLEAPMPIPDAIDLAEFIVEATATFTRFRRGHSTVGGPVESAAITQYEGFKWIKRKHYFNHTLNPQEDNHE